MHEYDPNRALFLHFSFLRDIKISGVYYNMLDRYLSKYPFLRGKHSHDFYSILLFTDGKEAILEINNDHYPVKPGTICLIAPYQNHSFETLTGINGIILTFCQDFYVEEFSYMRLLDLFYCTTQISDENCNPCISLSEDKYLLTGGLINSIIKEYDSYSPVDHTSGVIRSLLNILVLKLSVLYESKNERSFKADNIFIHELSRMVDSNFVREHKISFYASSFNVSEKYLNDICNRYFKCGLKKILTDRLMQEARKLLISSEMTISEISYKLNFEDNSYFNKVFKRNTRISPKKFRELHRNLIP